MAAITETLTIKTNCNVKAGGVYLRWKNSLGRWNYWYFDNKNIEGLTIEKGQTVNLNSTDFIPQSRLLDITGFRQIQISAYIPKKNIKGFEVLGESLLVEILQDVKTTLIGDTDATFLQCSVDNFTIENVSSEEFFKCKFIINIQKYE